MTHNKHPFVRYCVFLRLQAHLFHIVFCGPCSRAIVRRGGTPTSLNNYGPSRVCLVFLIACVILFKRETVQ